LADVIAKSTVGNVTADLAVSNSRAHIVLHGSFSGGWGFNGVHGSVVLGNALSVEPRAGFSVLADLLRGNAEASAHHQLARTISAECASRRFLAFFVVNDGLAPSFVSGK